MRSFMKAHRRGSSANIGDGSLLDLNTGTSATDERHDEKHNSAISASSSVQSSPIRQSPSSPIVARGKKLQRLFQRSKNSSQNLLILSNGIGSPSGNSPPPSIIGTRTHEWGKGSNDSHTGLTKPSSNRISVQSSQSSANSLYSLEGHNGLSSTSTQNRDPTGHLLTSEDSEGVLHAPLNAVLELPNEASLSPFMREIPDSADMDKKMRHRRAQIISADSFKLEDPAEIVPVNQFYKDKEMSSPELFNDGFVDPDETVAETIQNEKQRRKEQKQESQDDMDDHNDNDSNTSSAASEFSFEEDSKRGRNVSIKYYKSPEEGHEAQQSRLVKEQGFYVNDLIDDNFDEDMNYYDEFDDDYNDDEEIFNKKYFSDDEEEFVPKKKQPSIKKILQNDKVTPTNSIKTDITPTNSVLSSTRGEITPKNSFTAHKNTALNHSNSQLRSNSTSRPTDDLLKPRRSLKYHQLSTTYDQDIPQNRYSWFSDEEDGHHHNEFTNSSHSYDSLLDEINDIPEDFEFHSKAEVPIRSKSMNSSIRRNKSVYEDTPQNTKFESHNKTVTLFSRPSRQSSVKSNDSSEQQQQQQFGYLTPNGSFTMPTPGFVNGQNNELSPITEGSVDGSP